MADPHIHEDPNDKTRLNRGIQLLKDCEVLAKRNGTRDIIVAGDMWHSKHGVNQRVLLAIYRQLHAMKMRGYRVLWLRGNHEVTTKSHPAESLMWLFTRVACPIITPKIVSTEAHVLYFLPWYQEGPYKSWAKHFAKIALRDKRRKVLISHVGLKEGYTSASNIQLPQPISVGDLFPDTYDLVLLGDYHAHQMLADNTLYLGAPVPHTFGDRDTLGAWLLTFEPHGGNTSIEVLDLPSRHPRYETWDLSGISGDATVWLGDTYNEFDRNRIRVPVELVDKVRRLYPAAQVEGVDSRDPQITEGRMTGIKGTDTKNIFRAWLKSKGFKDKKYVELGWLYLTQA